MPGVRSSAAQRPCAFAVARRAQRDKRRIDFRCRQPHNGDMPGPQLRSDIVDVYVFRRVAAPRGAAEFLQLRRVSGIRMGGSWQPVMPT